MQYVEQGSCVCGSLWYFTWSPKTLLFMRIFLGLTKVPLNTSWLRWSKYSSLVIPIVCIAIDSLFIASTYILFSSLDFETNVTAVVRSHMSMPPCLSTLLLQRGHFLFMLIHVEIQWEWKMWLHAVNKPTVLSFDILYKHIGHWRSSFAILIWCRTHYALQYKHNVDEHKYYLSWVCCYWGE